MAKGQIESDYLTKLKDEKNIIINGYIEDYMADSVTYQLENLKDEAEVNVLVNSRGGDFISALMVHNRLRNSGKKVICYVETFAASAGAVVALAGDQIYMYENAILFFHLPKYQLTEPQGAEDLEKFAEGLRKFENALISTLVSKTMKSEEECRELCEKDTYMTPDEALEAGIIDGIIPINRNVGDLNEVSNSMPERIVNFLKEKRDMPLKEVCDKFGIEATEEKLIAFIDNLRASIPQKPTEVAPSILNLVKTSRITQLEALVTTGKATPVVVNELKVEYLSDDRLKKDIQTDNHKEFERVLNAFSKNDVVISFESKSGIQKLPDGKSEESPLVKDMKSRNKKGE